MVNNDEWQFVWAGYQIFVLKPDKLNARNH